MSILDKLMFWKKKDELPDIEGLSTSPSALPEEERFGRGYEMPEHPVFGGSQPPSQQFREFQQQFPQQPARDRDMEIISAKLDAIKANVESISQRLERLERLAMQ
ncbi:MAG: hypothetical protein QW331_00415 [Candidatus Woesearchaeota archaeon]